MSRVIQKHTEFNRWLADVIGPLSDYDLYLSGANNEELEITIKVNINAYNAVAEKRVRTIIKENGTRS